MGPAAPSFPPVSVAVVVLGEHRQRRRRLRLAHCRCLGRYRPLKVFTCDSQFCPIVGCVSSAWTQKKGVPKQKTNFQVFKFSSCCVQVFKFVTSNFQVFKFKFSSFKDICVWDLPLMAGGVSRNMGFCGPCLITHIELQLSLYTIMIPFLATSAKTPFASARSKNKSLGKKWYVHVPCGQR